jgi:hypothetical protein
MTGTVSVLVVYEPPGGRPLTVARVRDHRVLLDVAELAIMAAEHKAEELASADPVFGEVERAEAGRLRNVLNLLIPELRAREASCTSGVQ